MKAQKLSITICKVSIKLSFHYYSSPINLLSSQVDQNDKECNFNFIHKIG